MHRLGKTLPICLLNKDMEALTTCSFMPSTSDSEPEITLGDSIVLHACMSASMHAATSHRMHACMHADVRASSCMNTS